ncbi:hypothetical protein CYMTET_28766 [Cymbomonas tetramitiformis]|uniref:Uncharacterized protein n=1 Tax=Cymbomonas tetramitiformis TaxID=36881 RepID=A0AAE0FMB2_9CHLO|nr:hypothetical protein CYMTET_28766 [Cymbomonas tetramitiformis]
MLFAQMQAEQASQQQQDSQGQLDEEDDRPQTYYISGDEESEPKMYCPPPVCPMCPVCPTCPICPVYNMTDMMQKVKCPAPKCPDCQCPVAECARCPDCPEAQCPTCPECPFTRSCPECPVATCPPPKECPPEVNKADLDSAKLAEATARLDKVSESLAHSCDRDALLDKLLETERKYEELRRLYLREASATKRASFEVKVHSASARYLAFKDCAAVALGKSFVEQHLVKEEGEQHAQSKAAQRAAETPADSRKRGRKG